MEYYSALKNNDFLRYLDKYMELEDITQGEATKVQDKTHSMHSLISGYLHKLLEYQRHMKLKKKEDQSMDA